MNKYRYIFILFLLCAVVGCGNNVKLGGKVTFPDGEPLSTGMIIFSNDGFLARAEIKSDGIYDVGSLAEKDGLPPGKYKVYIIGAIEGEVDKLRSLIAPQYASRDTTPLEIEVPGQDVYNITVERP